MAANLGESWRVKLYSDLMIYSDLSKLKMNTLWKKGSFFFDEETLLRWILLFFSLDLLALDR